MNNFGLGFLLLILAGVMNAGFPLPLKLARKWAWENTWLIWSLFALLVWPAAAAFYGVPHLEQVYMASTPAQLLPVLVAGFCWGIAQVLFGLAVEAIGIALTNSLVLGTSAAAGALVPLLRYNRDMLQTSAGHALLLGIAMLILGVSICAIAGGMREKARAIGVNQQSRGATAGLVFAILAGIAAASMNLGLAFGAPLIKLAAGHGASPASASNAVWLPLLAAGAVPNLLYCLHLMRKNSSAGKFKSAGISHWAFAAVGGIFWFGSTLLYGASVALLGHLGIVVGWPLFMSLIVTAAGLIGMATGEWKRSGRWPLALQLMGISALVIAIFILARATQALALH